MMYPIWNILSQTSSQGLFEFSCLNTQWKSMKYPVGLQVGRLEISVDEFRWRVSVMVFEDGFYWYIVMMSTILRKYWSVAGLRCSLLFCVVGFQNQKGYDIPCSYMHLRKSQITIVSLVCRLVFWILSVTYFEKNLSHRVRILWPSNVLILRCNHKSENLRTCTWCCVLRVVVTNSFVFVRSMLVGGMCRMRR